MKYIRIIYTFFFIFYLHSKILSLKLDGAMLRSSMKTLTYNKEVASIAYYEGRASIIMLLFLFFTTAYYLFKSQASLLEKILIFSLTSLCVLPMLIII